MVHRSYGHNDGLDWALCFTWAQITDGQAECTYCAQPASLLIANGADPEDTPVCVTHFGSMAMAAFATTNNIFGPKAGSSVS